MNSTYQNLTLDGICFSKKELQKKVQEQLSDEQIPDWKKEIFQFIAEWIDGSPTIKAHTSGTTGTPKSIFLQKEKMIASARNTGRFFDLKKNAKALLCLSPKYIAGKMMIVRAFVLELDLIIVEPTGNPLRNLEVNEIDFAAMIPLQVFNTFQNERELNVFRKIKKTIIGGGVVGKDLKSFLQKEKNLCFATYGMTETITHVAVKQLNGIHAADIYQTLDNVDITIDSRNCLVINAPDVSDEKVVTNDLVEIVDEKHFRWLGRFDNVINSGGVKIVSEEVERIIGQFLEKRFFVKGLPDEKLGERLVLIIESVEFSEGEKNKLEGLIKNNLPIYSVPKEIFFVEKFIETETGKIKREATVNSL